MYESQRSLEEYAGGASRNVEPEETQNAEQEPEEMRDAVKEPEEMRDAAYGLEQNVRQKDGKVVEA